LPPPQRELLLPPVVLPVFELGNIQLVAPGLPLEPGLLTPTPY
jgi:hypothetical protein